jgi:elongation factor G
LQVDPLPDVSAFEFVNEIVGGAIPKEFIPAVEKGVVEALEAGVLAGYAMAGLRVTLYDGSYHDVDSSEIAFKIAGSMGLRQAAEAAAPVLLEPVMSVEVVVPEEYMGEVIGNLNSRRGRIEGLELRGTSQIIRSMVPLAQMFGYATDMRSLTQGRGSFTMHFGRYEEIPGAIAEEIISRVRGRVIK